MAYIFKYFKKLPRSLDDRKEFLIRRYAEGKILNAGCGNLKIPDSVNLDKDSKVKPDIVADFHRILFENNYFDVVLTFDTIEHTKNPKDFVCEIQRVVKPNGVILIACNDFDIQPQNWSADSTYATYINHKIFKKLLEPMGFFVFSLYRGYLVAVNKPRKGDKIFSIFYALYKRPLKIIKKFFFVNQ